MTEESIIDPAVLIARKQLEYMWELGRKYAQYFEGDNVLFTELMLVSRGVRGILVWIYCLLRNYKKIIALEDLTEEEKNKKWNLAKDVCQGEHKTRKKIHEVVMSFYALEYFLNEQK